MEELLNKLIEKGWRPFGKEYKNVCREPNKRHSYMFDYDVYYRRELVSKESGLWQFVCENGMVNKVDNDRRYFDELNDICYDKTFHDDECQYWIIESALCDEDKLEQFLLDNIKVE